MVDDVQGIEKNFLSHVRAPLGSKVKSLKKVKKLTLFKLFFVYFFGLSGHWSPVEQKGC